MRTEFAVGLFDEIMAAGRQHDLKLVGLHAVDSLRLAKDIAIGDRISARLTLRWKPDWVLP